MSYLSRGDPVRMTVHQNPRTNQLTCGIKFHIEWRGMVVRSFTMGNFTSLCPTFVLLPRNCRNSHFSLRFFFREAKWQFFGSMSNRGPKGQLFGSVSKLSISNGFDHAVGKFASFYRFNALNGNPSGTTDDVALLYIIFLAFLPHLVSPVQHTRVNHL